MMGWGAFRIGCQSEKRLAKDFLRLRMVSAFTSSWLRLGLGGAGSGRLKALVRDWDLLERDKVEAWEEGGRGREEGERNIMLPQARPQPCPSAPGAVPLTLPVPQLLYPCVILRLGSPGIGRENLDPGFESKVKD